MRGLKSSITKGERLEPEYECKLLAHKHGYRIEIIFPHSKYGQSS